MSVVNGIRGKQPFERNWELLLHVHLSLSYLDLSVTLDTYIVVPYLTGINVATLLASPTLILALYLNPFAFSHSIGPLTAIPITYSPSRGSG